MRMVIRHTSYHRDIFRPPILLELLFRKMAALFFEQKLSIKISIFSKFQNFLVFCFFLQNLNLGGKKHFRKLIEFDKHSAANLPPLWILKKIQVLFQ